MEKEEITNKKPARLAMLGDAGGEDTLTVYEVSYLLLPSLAPEQVPAKVGDLIGVVEKAGGEVISQENPTLIDLAYPMIKVVQTIRHKCMKGYFGWMKFEISPESIGKVKKSLDADGEILRYLIIKTVKENTLLNGKMKIQKEEREVLEDETEDVADIPKEVLSEEIDKSIDDLVIA